MADWMTVAEIADTLRTSHDTVRRAIKAGRLLAFKDGYVVRVRRADFDAYIERQQVRRAS